MPVASIRMVELKGKSGIRHRFSDAQTSSASEGPTEDSDVVVESVADVIESVATVTEVLTLYAKSLDVGAREASLEAPSFDEKAKEIAAEYGIHLKK